jgi:hypothetical protein
MEGKMNVITREVEVKDDRLAGKRLRPLSSLKSIVLIGLVLSFILALHAITPSQAAAQLPEPVVAIHVSEFTQALETMPATPPTPTVGYSGYEWWVTSWHYFVPYESLKEALRSDGTPFIEVSDAAIASGSLLYPDGSPKYPILISLAAEATTTAVVTGLRNYVSAGGFLFVGSSALTRNENGTTRGDFALAAEMGLHMVLPTLEDWETTTTFTKVADHRLVTDIPTGTLTWRMPISSDEISANLYSNTNHWMFQVSADIGTAVIANGDLGPLLATRQFDKGTFIYHGALQPLMGYGGGAPSMYAYLIYRHAIEWAFEAANVPIIKLSPWRYPYDAAFVVRHDFENDQAAISSIESSANFENSNGVMGDYYFCTGTLRSEMTGTSHDEAITGLQNAVKSYHATIGSHNGGLQNPVVSLPTGSFDYWHWGPDEALDSTTTGTYANGSLYSAASISISFADIEGWLSGFDNGRPGCAGNCPRIWAAPYFDSTREGSYGILEALGVKSATEQKISPFPHWTLSTQTAGKRYSQVTLPISDWYVNGDMTIKGGAMDGHTTQTMQAAVDFYYNLGALTNIYGHEVSDNTTLTGQYVQHAVGKGSRMWAANAVGIYDWWQLRSQITSTPTFTVSGSTATIQTLISGATDPDTSIEVAIPAVNGQTISNIQQVLVNGSPVSLNVGYRQIGLGNTIKIFVGASATSATVRYTVNNPVPAITGLSPANGTAGGAGFTLTVNGSYFVNNSVVQWNGSSRSTTYVSATQLAATILATDIATSGTATVTVVNPAPGGGISNGQAFPFNKINQAALNITAPATLMYGNTATLNSSGGSGTGSVTYSAGASTGCSVSGSTLSVISVSGTCAVIATKAADSTYFAATSSAATVALQKADQTITFNPPTMKDFGVSPFALNATANSGNPVTFVVASGPGSLTGTTLTITSAGAIVITASQAGNANYNAAADVQKTITVLPNGDLDGDGVVDISDALKALRIAAGLETPTALDLARGDVAPLVAGQRNPDGKIDLADVVAILRKVAGLTSW